MEIKVTYSPVFNLHGVTVETMNAIRWAAEHHYDIVCICAGRLGGFIYGWNNQITLAEGEPAVLQATWRELDTVAKILELTSMPGIPAEIIEPLKSLQKLIQQAMREESSKQ